MKTLTLCAAAAMLIAPVSAQAAHVSDTASAPTIRVQTSDLNLNKRADSAILLKRIDSAATEACGGWVSSNPIDVQAARASDCHKAAMDRAVARVNSVTVTALRSERLSLAARDH